MKPVPNSWPPFPVAQANRDRLLLTGFHLCLTGGLVLGLGWRIQSADYLALSTQFLSLRELADHLGRSLWHLQAQPPLHNLLIGLCLKVSESRFVLLLWGWNLLWSCLALWAVYGLARLLSGRRWAAIGLALWLPLAPDWLLYRAWANYTFPVMAYLLVLAWLTCRYHRTREPALLLGLAALLNGLMLTRSLFHLLLFGLPFCGLLLLFHWPQRTRIVLLLVLPTLVLSGGWYLKNSVQFGFFGASGWSNLGLMRVVGHEREKGFVSGHLKGTPQAYLVPVWQSCPSMFCDLVVHYWHALDHPGKGNQPVLHDLFEENLDGSRLHRNMNNINFLTINRDAGVAVRRLIRADPLGYLANVAQAYAIFCNPATKYGFLAANRKLIQGYVRVWERVFFPRLTRLDVTPLFFLYPLLLLGLAVSLVRALTRAQENRNEDREPFDDLLICGLVIYTVLISCLAELGENHRFSFLSLPLFLTWLIGRAVNLAGRLSRTRP